MTILEKLQEIYDSLPTMIDCKGLCWNSCGPIDMSTAERDRIIELGVLIPTFTEEASQRWANNEPLHCPALNRQTLRCDVYEARPLICRLWGATESMPCEHGCKPTRYLNDVEQYKLLLQTFRIGGHQRFDDGQEHEEMLAMLEDATVGPLMAKFIRGDRSVQGELQAAIDEYRKRA